MIEVITFSLLILGLLQIRSSIGSVMCTAEILANHLWMYEKILWKKMPCKWCHGNLRVPPQKKPALRGFCLGLLRPSIKTLLPGGVVAVGGVGRRAPSISMMGCSHQTLRRIIQSSDNWKQMSPERGPYLKDISFCNHWFSGDKIGIC